MKQKLNIVWLKRDLRTQDHVPLHHAEQEENDYLIIYLFEPQFLEYHDASLRHQQFIYHSIKEMNNKLSDLKREVIVFHEEALKVFSHLTETYDVERVFSYQESGVKSTWKRDKDMMAIFTKKGIDWQEFQRDGITRGIKNRKGWDQRWYKTMSSDAVKNDFTNSTIETAKNPYALSQEFISKLEEYPKSFQLAGEKEAWASLHSFCEDRGKNYSKFISKPLESRSSCGRLSPYLAWGNISIKQAYQYVKKHENFGKYKRGFSGMLTRLKWHCHFIQKFEAECDYETICVNRGYESLSYSNKASLIDAWKAGKTGFPLVDACMRCLHETGWINFRMRAMLVSVLCHQFDCSWKQGVYHLAQLFLDYEPGIHYTQFQM